LKFSDAVANSGPTLKDARGIYLLQQILLLIGKKDLKCHAGKTGFRKRSARLEASPDFGQACEEFNSSEVTL
jgi:hypothetical protein